MGTERSYWVYIMSSATSALYIGMTNDPERRVFEHKRKLQPGFTSCYNVTRLVSCEEYGDVWDAIGREKELKKWRREKKDDLIDAFNPTRADWPRIGSNRNGAYQGGPGGPCHSDQRVDSGLRSRPD